MDANVVQSITKSVYHLNAKLSNLASERRSTNKSEIISILNQLKEPIQELAHYKNSSGVPFFEHKKYLNAGSAGIYSIENGKLKGDIDEAKRDLSSTVEEMDSTSNQEDQFLFERVCFLDGYLSVYQEKRNRQPISILSDDWI